jgi:hypothetical protein
MVSKAINVSGTFVKVLQMSSNLTAPTIVY